MDPAVHPPPTRRVSVCCGSAIRTALVVGTVLTLINRPELLLGRDTGGSVARAAMNFVVPLLVAVYSRWRLARELIAERHR